MMRKIVISLIFVVIYSVHAMAQTSTPIPTPTLDPTVQAIDDDSVDYIATAQAHQDNPGLTTDGDNQVFYDGEPLLPDFQSPNTLLVFSYMKYFADSESSKAVFGPFAPIVLRIRILLILSLAWVVFYFVQWFIVLLIKFAIWLFNFIVSNFIPFLG